MALSVQLRGAKRVPQGSPLVRAGRVVSLMVSISVGIGMLLRIWGATSRRIRKEVSTPDRKSDIQQRLQSGRIPWWAPVFMLVARPVFALVTQLVVSVVFRLSRQPKPLREAGRWWMVSGTLLDFLSLGTLTWLTKREGIRLADLFNVRRERLGLDLMMTLGDLVALTPAVGISAALTRLFYGPSGQPPQVAVARNLPVAASAYSILVWPVIWSMTEEATYLGYTLPRLEALTGNTAVSAALVSTVWALQHESLPLLLDGRYLVYRPLSALPVTFTTTLLYLLRGRRLPPLMVAHWAADAASALLAALPQRHVSGTPTW
jgi:hypothetical protein